MPKKPPKNPSERHAQVMAERRAEKLAERERKKQLKIDAKKEAKERLKRLQAPKLPGHVRFPAGDYVCINETCAKPFTRKGNNSIQAKFHGMCPTCIRKINGEKATVYLAAGREKRRRLEAEHQAEKQAAIQAEVARQTAALIAADKAKAEAAGEAAEPLFQYDVRSALSRSTKSIVTPEEVAHIQNTSRAMLASTDDLTTEQLVDREIAMRELARRKLIWFTMRRRPMFKAGWFHIDLAERLERFVRAVQRGESPRLLIAAPPRHGKSTLSSEDMPAWAQGQMPDIEIIASSYNIDLAKDFSKVVQTTMESTEFKVLFDGLTLSDHSKSVEAWMNSKNGRYRATGVGGSLTGRGAHILLIEDPFKNREDADSAGNRKKVWDWYTSTAYTRLMPGGGVIVIATRWHEDDLTGRLLEQMKQAEREFLKTGIWPADADRWEVVSYPAIAIDDEVHRKAGEALHPERYPLEHLLRIRRTQDGGARDWAALYQQSPVPEEGAYFTRDMIHFYDGAVPPGVNITGGDLAVSKEQHADSSVYLTGTLDAEDNLYIIEGVRGKFDAFENVEKIFDIYRTHKSYDIGIGKDVIEKSIGPFMEQRIREEKLYGLTVTPMPHNNHDKEARARPIQGRMRQKKVFLPRGAAFLEWLLPEILAFPNAAHDDAVDALAILGQMLVNHQYQPPRVEQPKSWRDKLATSMNLGATLPNAAMGA